MWKKSVFIHLNQRKSPGKFNFNEIVINGSLQKLPDNYFIFNNHYYDG